MSATTLGQVHKTSSGTKPLWIAVGALGTAVLVMAATLVYQQARPAESRITPMPAMVSVPAEKTPAAIAAPTTSPSPQAAMRQDESEKPVAALVKKAPVAAKSVATRSDRVSDRVSDRASDRASGSTSTSTANASNHGAGSNAPSVSLGYPPVAMDSPVVVAQRAPQVVRPVCGNCGTVESATPIQREGAGTGLGAVAGGVLGAVVGNQVGGGNGRTVATVLGALGGGWAGNSVEKKMKNETLYQVRVRMEDGATRTFEVATPVGAGSHVTVEGGSLRLADGSLASPLPARPQRQTQQSSPSPMQTGG